MSNENQKPGIRVSEKPGGCLEATVSTADNVDRNQPRRSQADRIDQMSGKWQYDSATGEVTDLSAREFQATQIESGNDGLVMSTLKDANGMLYNGPHDNIDPYTFSVNVSGRRTNLATAMRLGYVKMSNNQYVDASTIQQSDIEGSKTIDPANRGKGPEPVMSAAGADWLKAMEAVGGKNGTHQLLASVVGHVANQTDVNKSIDGFANATGLNPANLKTNLNAFIKDVAETAISKLDSQGLPGEDILDHWLNNVKPEIKVRTFQELIVGDPRGLQKLVEMFRLNNIE